MSALSPEMENARRELRLRLQLALELVDQWPLISGDLDAALVHIGVAVTKAQGLRFHLGAAERRAAASKPLSLVPHPKPSSPPSPPSPGAGRVAASGAARAAPSSVQRELIPSTAPPRRG